MKDLYEVYRCVFAVLVLILVFQSPGILEVGYSALQTFPCINMYLVTGYTGGVTPTLNMIIVSDHIQPIISKSLIISESVPLKSHHTTIDCVGTGHAALVAKAYTTIPMLS